MKEKAAARTYELVLHAPTYWVIVCLIPKTVLLGSTISTWIIPSLPVFEMGP